MNEDAQEQGNTEFTCAECGHILDEGESYEYHGEMLCETCYDNHFEICQDCEELFDIETEELHRDGLCPECSADYFECRECGYVLHLDNYAGDGLCIECHREMKAYIKDYHDGSDAGVVFHPHEGKPLYFGIELETENYHNRTVASKALHELSNDENLFWQEEDCSLENGIEIITQPGTLEFFRDKFPWDKIRETVRFYGGFSENTEHAALHIHFNRSYYGKESQPFSMDNQQRLREVKLVYLFERFWDNLVRLARTSDYLLERSAQHQRRGYLTNRWHLTSNGRHLGLIQDRYMAVNLRSSKPTIEIRLFRGTLNKDTILASLELVDFLIHLAKRLTIREINHLTWRDLLKRVYKRKYLYLPQYLEKKNAWNFTWNKFSQLKRASKIQFRR